MPKSKPPYPPEFRREALDLIKISDKPIWAIGLSELALHGHTWSTAAQVSRDPVSRSAGPEVRAQGLSLPGRETGSDDAIVTVDDIPGAGTAGPCKAVVVGSVALAAGQQDGYLLAWSGALAGFPKQVWLRSL